MHRGSPVRSVEERRAHPRYRVHAPARVGAGGGPLLECTVQDFCLGGMLLRLPPESDAHYPVNARVRVSLPAGNHEPARAFDLAARVVRRSSGGMGLAFEGRPEPAAIAALHARAPGATPAPPETAPPAADREALLARGKDLILRHAEAMLQAFFAAVDRRLVEAAEAARSNADRSRFMDMRVALKRRRGRLARRFRDALAERFSEMAEDRASQVRDGELTLVPPGEFEAWLAIHEVIARTEDRHEHAQEAITDGLSRLLGHPMDPQASPFGPAGLSQAFAEALGEGLREDLREVAYGAWEQALGEGMGGLQREVGALLESRGVLRDGSAPRYRIIRREDRQRPPRDRAAPAASSAAEPPTPAASPARPPSQASAETVRRQPAAGDFVDAAVCLLHPVAAVDQPPAEPAAEPRQARPYTAEQVAGALSRLDRATSAEEALALKANVLTALRQADPQGTLPGEQADALDVMGRLFAAMLADDGLVPEAARWIGDLQAPLARVLAGGGQLFRPESHPARRLLNRLDELAQLGGGADAPLVRRVDALMARVREALERGEGLPEDTVEELEGMLEQQRTGIRRNLERVAREARARQLRADAARAVACALERRLAGREIPGPLAHIVEQAWTPLLKLVYTAQGPDGEAWDQHLAVLDRLLALDGRPSDARDARPLHDAVVAGLDYLGLDGFERRRALEAVGALLTGGPAERVTLALECPTEAPSPPRKPDDLAADDWDRALSSARGLRVGTRLRLSAADGTRRILTLAFAADGDGPRVLTDPRGLASTPLAVAELAEGLARGTAAALPDTSQPLVDRAAQRMLQELHDRLAFQATHDPLTGLVNRKELEKRIERALLRSQRDHAHHALLHLGVDQTRLLNSSAGREAGDALLAAVAGALQRVLDRPALVARVGGDEFGVLLEGCSLQEARRLAEAQRESVRQLDFAWQGRRFAATVCVGMASVTAASESATSALREAEAAYALAREAGRDHLQVYTPGDADLERRERVMHWALRLDKSLDDGRLFLRGQRIAPADPQSAERGHYEVLLGVLGEGNRSEGPTELIRAAELYGRMTTIDRWVVSRLFRWLSERLDRLQDYGGFAVNLSGLSLSDPGLPNFLEDQFAEWRIPCERVSFEVTETVAVADIDHAVDFIEAVKRLGCRFALDDFGSGLSSFAYLKHLPVDFLKIDGAFVRDIATNSADFAMVRSINEMAHFLGKRTIAEYAHSEAVIARLREIGVDFLQGYAVERPRPLAELA